MDDTLWYVMMRDRHSAALAEAVRGLLAEERQPIPIFSQFDVDWLKELKVSVGPCI